MAGRVGIVTTESVEGLTDYLELPFDGTPELPVSLVFAKRPILAPAANAAAGFKDINQ